jgi:transglutaminase-like putative cysteine protease
LSPRAFAAQAAITAASRPPSRGLAHRALAAAPLLVVTALLGWASGAGGVAALLVAVIAGSLALPERARARLSVFTQRMIAAAFGGVGLLVGSLHTPELGYGRGALPRAAASIAAGALLAAASRLYVRADASRYAATFALGLVALTACGATRSGAVYPAVAALFLAAGLVAMRADDPARESLRALDARHRAGAAVAVAIAVALALVLARAMPPLHDWGERRFEDAVARRNVIGFSSRVALGQMKDMLRSDAIVLRLTGPSTDYLRGAVYDRYHEDGTWHGARGDRLRPVETATWSPRASSQVAPAGGGAVAPPPVPRVDVEREGGDAVHYFLPLDVRALATEAGSVQVDPAGAAVVASALRANHYAFALGPRDTFLVTGPTEIDLAIPGSLEAPLARIAAEWTAGATTPEAKLARIAARLEGGEYAYSLAYTRTGDPLLDFLLVHKQGHCTYFATAMTLLARAANVPARMVAGYRVAERNALTGQYIVRQDNAHAWVEAWTLGRWATVDATPMSEVAQNLPHSASLARVAVDLVASAWARALDWAGARTLPEILIALGAMLALLALVRWLRARAKRRTARAADADRDPPLPCFERLTRALVALGLPRAPSESLDHFARRLDAADRRDAAALVRRYAELRYGSVGDATTLEHAIDRWLTASPWRGSRA